LHRTLVKNIEEKPITDNAVQITNFSEDTYVRENTYFREPSTFDKNTDKRGDTKNVGLNSSIHTNAAARSISDLYLITTRLTVSVHYHKVQAETLPISRSQSLPWSTLAVELVNFCAGEAAQSIQQVLA